MSRPLCVLLFLLLALGPAGAAPPGNIIFDGGTKGDVIFSHSRHVRLGMDCKDCHSGLFPKKNDGNAGTMEGMYRGESCGKCHDGKRAFSARSCSACHKGNVSPEDARLQVPKGGGTVQRGDVAFSHAAHSDAGLRCYACHPTPFAMKKGSAPLTMKSMEAGATCGKCHNGKLSFSVSTYQDCSKCHTQVGRKDVRRNGVTFRHTSHAGRYSCAECHPRPFKMKAGTTPMSMAAMYDGQQCGKCHNGTKAFASTACTKCHDNAIALGGTITYPDKVLGAARFSHQVHAGTMAYKCQSCHPAPFQMQAHGTGFTMGAMLGGQNCGSCHNGQEAFSAQSCSSCHSRVGPYGGYGARGLVSWKSRRIGKVTFDHSRHMKGRTCDSCHTGPGSAASFPMKATRLPMAAMYRQESCGACHNGQKAFATADCTRCHVGMAGPADFRYEEKSVGPVTFSHKGHAKVACKTCHAGSFKPRVGGTELSMDLMYAGKQCGSCHNGTKAVAVSDCRACHAGDGMPGDLTYPEESMGPIRFSHENHTAMGMKCNDCHNGVFRAKKGAAKMTMAAMGEGKECGTCHNGKKAFSVDDCTSCHVEPKPAATPSPAPVKASPSPAAIPSPAPTASPSPAPTTSPSPTPAAVPSPAASPKPSPTASPAPEAPKKSGPPDVTWPEESLGPITFSHSIHLGNGAKCGDCHPKTFAMKAHSAKITMDAINAGQQCGTCHNGSKAFAADDCTRCHVQK